MKINDHAWFDFLKKLKMLSKHFSHLQETYTDALTYYKKKVEDYKEKCFAQISYCEGLTIAYDQFSEMILEIIRAQELMS